MRSALRSPSLPSLPGAAVSSAVVATLLLGACAGADVVPDAAGNPDGGTADARADGAPVPDGSGPPPPDGAGPPDALAGPWRHTIVIDGNIDFVGGERFLTTSAGYTAYVGWDDAYLYLGYEGPDIELGDPQRWVLAYIDVDPGAGTGATSGEAYNTQTPSFPTGFGAEYYFRWKTDNSFQSLRIHGAGGWTDADPLPVETFQSATFVETRIPLVALGSPARVGVTTLMLNETPLAEAAYAGLYEGSFTDGYHPVVPIGSYLLADFALELPPNDPARRRP